MEFSGEGTTNVFVHNNTISRNNITFNDEEGIYLSASGWDTAVIRVTNNTISGNYIAFNMEDGIELEYDERESSFVELNYTNIIANTIIENGEIGIYLDDYSYITLLENKLYGNVIMIETYDNEDSTHTIDTTNKANNKPVYYYTDKIGLGSSDFTNAGQVILINCNDSIVSGLDLSNASMGIALYHSRNVTIYNNTVSYGLWGMTLYASFENNITGNRANNNDWYGLLIVLSNDNNITGNTANNNNVGISLWLSNYTIVSGNVLLGNSKCIQEVLCIGNIILNNNCGAAAAAGDDDDDDDDDKVPPIPGYDLFIFISTIFILIGIIYIIFVRKRLKS